MGKWFYIFNCLVTKLILPLVWVQLPKFEAILLMYFSVSTLTSLNERNTSSIRACYDYATWKPIQYNTCFIIFSTVIFSSATTSSIIKNSHYFDAAACIFRFCALGALFYISCVFFVDTRRCDQYSTNFYGIFTLILWCMSSSIVCTCLGLINQVDYEL